MFCLIYTGELDGHHREFVVSWASDGEFHLHPYDNDVLPTSIVIFSSIEEIKEFIHSLKIEVWWVQDKLKSEDLEWYKNTYKYQILKLTSTRMDVLDGFLD